MRRLTERLGKRQEMSGIWLCAAGRGEPMPTTVAQRIAGGLNRSIAATILGFALWRLRGLPSPLPFLPQACIGVGRSIDDRCARGASERNLLR